MLQVFNDANGYNSPVIGIINDHLSTSNHYIMSGTNSTDYM